MVLDDPLLADLVSDALVCRQGDVHGLVNLGRLRDVLLGNLVSTIS